MQEASSPDEVVFRAGTSHDRSACVSIWVEACASRDGIAVAGVAERARPKFDHEECWVVGEVPSKGIVGFVLATRPGGGLPGDPVNAPVIGLLAVAPGAQGLGVGSALMDAVASELAQKGHTRSVLHALLDNLPAVRLYASKGWRPFGEVYQHALLKRPMQTFVLDLDFGRASQRTALIEETRIAPNPIE